LKKAILMCGIPRAGKSTYIENVLKKKYKKPFIISPENLRNAMTGTTGLDDRIESLVWWMAHKLFDIYSKEEEFDVVVIDATSLSIFVRNKWIEAARRNGVSLGCVYLKTPKKVLLERNKKSEEGKKVPDNQMEAMIERFVEPKEDEGFNAFKIVEGEQSED